MYALRLVWKKSDGGAMEDVLLGTCYLDTRPVKGELISFTTDASPGQGVWKVVLVYHHPVMEGSTAWRNWLRTREVPQCLTYYWVEPVEGPWE